MENGTFVSEPVTAVVRRRIHPGCEPLFEDLMREFMAFALRQPGHLGINVLRASVDSSEYTVLDRFATVEDRRRFTASPDYQQWMTRLREVSDAEPEIEERGGLAFLFTLPNRPPRRPPSRPKMAVITLIGVYPLSMLFPALVVPATPGWPGWLRGVVIAGLIVVSLAWVVMPALTRVFEKWLFPRRKAEMSSLFADTIYRNGRIATLDRSRQHADAIAVRDGKILAVGGEGDVARYRGESTTTVDLNGRTVIPGLNDSHLHLIRGGLNFNMELRWDGVPSLADAMRMLKEQARRTPPPQWVRVVGGWTEQQFAERRMPTLEEINEATGETPCFILHLYDRAWLNAAALRICGYTKDSANPPGGEIQRDSRGEPTGLLIARPNANILYSTLAKAPKLSPEDASNSTRLFMREMNRLGLTSAIDAGGGFQNYPDDYRIVEQLAARDEITVRLAYNLFTQKPKQEREDFARWVQLTKPGAGTDYYRVNGAGEMLVFSAADFEDFLEPRPELPSTMEAELEQVIRVLIANRWPFRLHATYNESIDRMLNVFEAVNRDIPFNGLHWFFDHAETIDDRNIARVGALGGGIALQHRMAYQGEYFVDRYGAEAARRTPPCGACSSSDCRWARARTPRAWRATTRGWRCTG